jgi:hypothetical protein
MAKKNPKNLTKKFVGKPLPEVDAISADASAVQQGPRKKKQIGNYKRVDSQFADAFRDILPVPDNVAQMLAKTIRGDARMSNASLDDEQKVMLWDVIQNAKKRTGKPDGGTEYQDYGGLGYGDSEQFNKWFNRGQYNVFEGAYNSLTNPGFKLGSTIGRGKYFTDPENPDKIYYTDVYDWNAHEKNFPGINIYQKVRNTLRSGEDSNLTAEKNENYRMNFELDAKEIEKLRKSMQPPSMENGGWLDKYQDGGWTVSPKVAAYNKAARQTPTDIDANAMQALEQVTSYPQRKVTEWITGKNQYPSQALGIKNPYGAFAADFALDPLNVLGLPAAVKTVGKLGKGAKNIAKVTKAIAKGEDVSKSTINWAKWNKEIPSNKALMQEYKAIEQTSKADGTWMKNADGSKFTGTPEQFVQQQSSNFKKAFPEGATTFYRGGTEHIDDFVNRNRNDWALFGTDDLDVAKKYAWHRDDIPGADKSFYNSNTPLGDAGGSGLYELGYPSQTKSVEASASGRGWRFVDYDPKIAEGTGVPNWAKTHNENLRSDFISGDKYYTDKTYYDVNKDYLDTDAYANYVKNSNNPETVATIRNVIDGGGKPSTVSIIDAMRTPIKSLRYNNGMFDLSNPNIYKSLAPFLGAGFAASQLVDQKKDGGWLDKYQPGGVVAKADATVKPKPGPVFLGNPYAKEMAKRQTYLNPQGKSAAPAMKQAALDRAKSEKTTDLNKKIASYAQNIGGALELAAPFTGPAMPILGAIGAGLDVGASTYLAGKDISEGNYESAAMNAGFGALGAAGFAPMVKYNRGLNAAINTVDDVSDIAGLYNSYDNLGREYAGKVRNAKNLEDLKRATQFAEQYGYKLPENLERIAQSDELTNRTIRGMMDRHNTFVRGTSTNWDVLGKKNPEILKHLEQQGIDWKNNPKAAAEYMATHVPIQTGYGRASLDKNVFNQGLDAIYTSNSIPTAEGYTYGQGFVTKVKKPTDFSSSNRQDWITQNNPQYYKDYLPTTGNFDKKLLRTEYVDDDAIVNDLMNNVVISPEKFPGLAEDDVARKAIMTKYKELNEKYPKWMPGEEGKLNAKKYNDELYDFLKGVDNQTVQDLIKLYESQKGYSHYLHLGKPGEQILQPIKSIEITPEIWKNKSRAHINLPTDKLSRAAVAPLGIAASESVDEKKNGGWLEKYNDGGPVQENYNDYSVSAPKGFQGDGYSNVGRNYSPAWGGQFQDGGNLSFIDNPKLRNMLEGYKPGFMQTVGDYRLPEGYMAGSIYPSTEVSTSIGGEGGEPAYLIPSFKYGQPLQDPVQEFNMTEQYLGGPFKTWQDAEKFQEIRHQYVEKGQPLPSPIATSNMAMGGSMPGAVGFTYARTKGIPSNGPYAKKTKASAQDGTTIYSGMLPEITVVGSKDPQTEEFYRTMLDRLSKEEGKRQGLILTSDDDLDVAFDDPISTKNILGRYEGLMDLGKKYGFPKVHPRDPDSIFAVASKLSDTELDSGPRPNYNPFTKTIQASTSKNWLDEMAHHVQFKNNPISTGLKFLTNDVPAYISGKSPYSTLGTMEHEAHSIIEPKLEEEIEASKRNYRQLPYIQKLTEQFYGPIENYQNGGEMRYYQEGLDFKPKTISRNGSVIKDDRGQWAHPGKVTQIGSNQITMQGVPYPVLGISDTGDTQMMYPNQDYIYDGSSVTEYPMMKQGGQLTKLDQLLNFTNYNTKQPGGWLDKYQD